MSIWQSIVSPSEKFNKDDIRRMLWSGMTPEQIFDDTVKAGCFANIMMSMHSILFPIGCIGLFITIASIYENSKVDNTSLYSAAMCASFGVLLLAYGFIVPYAVYRGTRKPTAEEIAQRKAVLAAYCRSRLEDAQRKESFLKTWANADRMTISAN